MQTFRRVVLGKPQFWWKEQGQFCWTCIHDLRVDFVTGDCLGEMAFAGMLNFKHRKLNGKQDWIGWGIKLSLRCADSFAQMPAIPASSVNLAYWQSAPILPFSKVAGNILSAADHYGFAPLAGVADLEPCKAYRLEAWANAHSSAWPDGTNGLIEMNQNEGSTPEQIWADPYSYLTVKVS